MKITVETTVRSDLATAWAAWTRPEDIERWNAASDDWHTTESEVDLREGGSFYSRMEARDGSAGFDFRGTYTRVVEHETIAYELDDGRRVVVEFEEADGGVRIRETFDAETEMDEEFQRRGWQAILDNFARHVEAKEP